MENPLKKLIDAPKQANLIAGLALTLAFIALVVAVKKGGK